ncbi:hypothetical protein Pcinc_006647 [Petrolisthes cinctipes]|uniref:CCHC-type domain-containing protein n=1 Tax=Petrolisthes cinctipes TaxID=88211 RepID=A0AAE1L1C3_PETCI|nr:hypothetical protein Pcinc_006647 [Petrolisthes cinctipes]
MDASPPLHSKIAWAGQAGFPGARYCCICSYSTRDKPVTPCTEENCPNSACRECFSDADFNCSQTADIRVARGFSRPVTYEANTPTIPESEEANGEELTHEQEEETEEEVIQHHISSSTKEELATRLVLLQGEYKKQGLIIKRYREQTKLLLDHKTALAKTLSVLETIEIAEQQEQLPQATTRATSALPSKIDEDWENLCSVSASCQSWWLSGKPRKLAKVTACSTPTLSDDSADRNSEATTSVSYRDSGTQAKEGESRENNCHLPNAGENCNIGGNKSGDKSGNNNRRIGNRQQQSRQRATRTRQQQEVHHHPPTAQHGSSLSPRHPAGQGNSIYNRPAKQHRPPAPPKGRGEEPVCSYCSRRGHTIKDCKTRAAEQRQEHLLRRVIAEVRQPIPSFPPPPPGFSHIVPQPPMWGQTPGWQWTSNLPYLSNQANQHQLK